jgi:Protein of unknown function (DUF1116)
MMVTLGDRIAAANEIALRRLADVDPLLVRVRPAAEVIPALKERLLLHAGPPIAAGALCGPMRGAALGAAVFEGWARDLREAEALLDRGAIALRPAHDEGAVGPMAGIISSSMPLLEVRDVKHGISASAPLNEGIGAVLRFGANDDAVIGRLCWLREILAPALDRALRQTGAVPLVPLMARALTMGDEMHQRNVAATSLLFRAVAPALVEHGAPGPAQFQIVRFLADNDQFFLNVAMAAAKCATAAVGEIRYSTVVTAMSRNGVEFGIRVSGLGDRWFTAPASVPDGMYFPGFTREDASPDMGDSAIIETIGLGGMAMAASPALGGFVGLPSMRDAIAITRSMGEITLGQSPHFKIPTLDFAGAPLGIDLRRVVKLRITPVINTGIAHRQAGKGQIGAGIVRAPLPAFEAALAAFAARYAPDPGSATLGEERGGGRTV